MLTQIDLEYFKCFDKLHLPLRPLTLLSGANASGKSSILQALVLLHQTMREHERSSRLMLNGTAIRLGSVTEVVNRTHGRSNEKEYGFGIGLEGDEGECQWKFSGRTGSMSMSAEVSSVSWEMDGTKGNANTEGNANNDAFKPLRLHHLLPEKSKMGDIALMAKRLRDLNYLSAERMGPCDIYPVHDPQTTPTIGPRGEHAGSLLDHNKAIPRNDKTVLYDKDSTWTLLGQTEARMRRFFPGFGWAFNPVERAHITQLALSTSEIDLHSPIHTGFGVTQVLPIVVAALSLDEGGLLMVENPEVHLHPAGQAQIGRFLAEVASEGRQVILETHSDHVLNGVRRAVKDGVLDHDKAALHFFRTLEEQSKGCSPVESPELDKYGKIDYWPDGFFDQFDKDISHLSGLRG